MSQKAYNAREGIETKSIFGPVRARMAGQKAYNAREGIETDMFEVSVNRYEGTSESIQCSRGH